MKEKVLDQLTRLVVTAVVCLSFLFAPGLSRTAFASTAEVPADAKNFLNKLSDSLAAVAAATAPSVVNISTTTVVTMKNNPYAPYLNDPFFRKFFGDLFNQHQGPSQYKESALGSGVIVSSDGNILTNFHVVKGATEIKVILSDGKEFKGKVVGSDAETDIAVVKIDAKDLPAIRIGDSNLLKAGDVVLAIGNPFGLNQTVTMGIVSAVGRANVGISTYENFIQTDAAINPGNSGGAMVNTAGELVGINTAIFSTSGGYMGIGFAIPSSMANSVAQSILKHGKVIRGWLGVTVQKLTPELAKSLHMAGEKGVLVSEVVKHSPADKAGMKRGDLIIEFAGKPVDNPLDLRNLVSSTSPGKKVELKVLRDGKKVTLPLTIEEAPAAKEQEAPRASINNVTKGVQVQELTSELRRNLDIPEDVNGVVVVDVSPDSAASGVLTRGDVILEVDRKHVSSVEQYDKIVEGIGPSDTVLLLIYRKGGYLYLTIQP